MKKEKKSGLKFIWILIIVTVVLAIVFAKRVDENGGGVQGVLLTMLGGNVNELEELDTIYVLVMGVSTDLNTNLTDTIMLCGYNPKTNSASVLSIPRDTFTGTNKFTATGSQKINCLYAKGPEKTLEKVEEITGLDIDYYAVIKNEALIELVDLIGGVEFEVPIDMEYDDPTQDLHIKLDKGLQVLDGEKAEMLLRFRHNNDGSSYPANYGDNDYGRMKTQRAFIKATISQSLKFKNIIKSKSVMETVFENIETNLSMDTIMAYIPYGVNLNLDEMKTEQLPGESELCNGIWIYVHDKTETKELVKDITTKLEYGY